MSFTSSIKPKGDIIPFSTEEIDFLAENELVEIQPTHATPNGEKLELICVSLKFIKGFDLK